MPSHQMHTSSPSHLCYQLLASIHFTPIWTSHRTAPASATSASQPHPCPQIQNSRQESLTCSYNRARRILHHPPHPQRPAPHASTSPNSSAWLYTQWMPHAKTPWQAEPQLQQLSMAWRTQACNSYPQSQQAHHSMDGTINCWIVAILPFNFKLAYVPANKYKGLDGLSRCEPVPEEDKEDDNPKDWVDNTLTLGVWVVSWVSPLSPDMHHTVPLVLSINANDSSDDEATTQSSQPCHNRYLPAWYCTDDLVSLPCASAWSWHLAANSIPNNNEDTTDTLQQQGLLTITGEGAQLQVTASPSTPDNYEDDCYIPWAIFLFSILTNPFPSHDCLLDMSPDSFLAYLTAFLSS